MHFMSFHVERGTESKTLVATKTLKLCKYLHLRASFGYSINISRKEAVFSFLSSFLIFIDGWGRFHFDRIPQGASRTPSTGLQNISLRTELAMRGRAGDQGMARFCGRCHVASLFDFDNTEEQNNFSSWRINYG